jgi:multiple sugar transport system substrate-binding protein
MRRNSNHRSKYFNKIVAVVVSEPNIAASDNVTYAGDFVLMYNKEIFDKFNIAFPTDGMTWDQAYAMAVKLTRQDGGVNYRGFGTPNSVWYNNQLSLQIVNPKTNKASFYTDGWIKEL